MSIFAGVPLWWTGFTFSGCPLCPPFFKKNLSRHKLQLVFICVFLLRLRLRVCVCVLWFLRLQTVWVKTTVMHLFVQRQDCFSLSWGRGNTLSAARVNPFAVIAKQDIFCCANSNDWLLRSSHLGNFLSCFTFHFSYPVFIPPNFSCHPPSLAFPVVVCFLVWLNPLPESPYWALQKAWPHHGNSESCQDDFIMSQSVLCLAVSSHSFHTSLHTHTHSPVCRVTSKQKKEKREPKLRLRH